MKVSRMGDVRCTVGEGPCWDKGRQLLYFVDIVGQALWRFAPADGSFRQWPMPRMIAAVSLDDKGGLVAALADGFYAVDPDSGAVSPIADARLPAGTAFNDAKVDRQGRFVAGSADAAMQAPIAGLFRLDGSSVVAIDEGYTIANGPCWSPDGGTFYCADSIPRQIHAYDYDVATGAVSNRRLFASTEQLGGIPDGATIDSRGRMWMAICGAGKVVAFAPDGLVERIVEMPTLWVSSVAFGGTGLDRLYVTSLDPTAVGLPADDGAGYLYAIDGLGAAGLAETPVAL